MEAQVFEGDGGQSEPLELGEEVEFFGGGGEGGVGHGAEGLGGAGEVDVVEEAGELGGGVGGVRGGEGGHCGGGEWGWVFLGGILEGVCC